VNGLQTSRLILASQSKARAAMLSSAGLDVDLVPADLDERALDATLTAQGASAADIALALAEAKALAVSPHHPDGLVIGADQTLECGRLRLSKVKTLDEARQQLLTLSGKDHWLHSACAVARNGQILFQTVNSARMSVRPLSDAFVTAYLEEAGPAILGSVGCYHYEGLGLQLFSAVDGDYHTVLGMPLLPLLAFLREEGVLVS